MDGYFDVYGQYGQNLASEAIVVALIQSALLLLLVRFLVFYDRKPPLSLLALLFVWGAVGATLISVPVNNAFFELLDYASPDSATVLGAAITGPLAEETAKGIALVAVLVLSRPIASLFGVRFFDGVATGMLYGAAVGLGFAFNEDMVYFFRTADEQGDLGQGLSEYLNRVLYGPEAPGQLGHAVYTGLFGAGLGLAVWSRSWAARIFFPLLGLGAAMLAHAVHNNLLYLVLILGFGLETTAELIDAVQSGQEKEQLVDLFGEALVFNFAVLNLLRQLMSYGFAALFFLAIWLWVRYQRRVIREELAEEVEAGLISEEDREIAPRYWYRLLLYWRVLWSGEVEQWRALRQRYDDLVDLALLKRRLRRAGGDWDQVEKLRQRIKKAREEEAVG